MSTTRRFSSQQVSRLSVGMLALIAMVMLGLAWIGQSSQPLSAAGDLTPVDMPAIDTLLPSGATLSFTPSFTRASAAGAQASVGNKGLGCSDDGGFASPTHGLEWQLVYLGLVQCRAALVP